MDASSQGGTPVQPQSTRRWLTKPRVVAAAFTASLLLVLTSMPVFAAMDATLSSDHARVGDQVLLLSDDHKGVALYWELSSENHQHLYLGPTTITASDQGCGAAGTAVGQLEWRGNASGLSFTVPPLPDGDYWLFMETSGQCWRLGGGNAGTGHVLGLRIGSVPADNQEMAKEWTPDQLGPPASQPSPHPRARGLKAAQSSSAQSVPWAAIALFGSVILMLVAIAYRTAKRKGLKF